MKPDQTLAWMHDGTQKLLANVAALSDEALAAPTALPGWTRRYLLSHVAANADALRNLVHWARTGEERRMYSSPEQRDADIAKGSELPAAELRAWLESSAQALATDLDTLPDQAWDAKVITAQGLTRSASEIPWMRVREVYIHAIDLAAGTAWADLPAKFLTDLLDDVTARRSSKGGGPALAIAATDTGHTWEIAGAGAPLPVSASLADLAAYLTGRPPELKAAPALPAWLLSPGGRPPYPRCRRWPLTGTPPVPLCPLSQRAPSLISAPDRGPSVGKDSRRAEKHPVSSRFACRLTASFWRSWVIRGEYSRG